MTKDVLVSIRGAHMLDGDSDDVSVITAGSYYYKNGKHFIIYDEMVDDIQGSIRSTIKIGGGVVDIIKGGSARSHMVFEQDKTNVSCYVMPFGQMMVGVTTDRIDVEERPDQLQVRIDYTLEINYERVSRCHIELEVSSKASAQLHLSE